MVNRTTSDKSNASKIRSRIHQAIFKEFMACNDGRVTWLSGVFDRSELSHIADIATKAIMKEERLDVVLSKQSNRRNENEQRTETS